MKKIKEGVKMKKNKIGKALIVLGVVILITVMIFLLNKNDEKNDLSKIKDMQISNEFKDSIQHNFKKGFDDNGVRLGSRFELDKSFAYVDRVNTQFYLLELEKTNFYIDSSLNLDEINIFIADNIEYVNYIVDNYKKGEKINIYITDDFNSSVIDGKICIRFEEEYSSQDIISQILFGLYGEESNYGLVYAESMEILSAFDEYDDIKLASSLSEKLLKEIEEDSRYFNMLYPIYTSQYSKTYQIEYAKELAIAFSAYIKETYGEIEFINLLEESSAFDLNFDKKYAKYMNEFLIKQGSDVQMSESQNPIRSKKMGGNVFKICVESKNIAFLFDSKDSSKNMNGNYDVMMSYITSQINYVDRILSYFSYDKKKLDVVIPVYISDVSADIDKYVLCKNIGDGIVVVKNKDYLDETYVFIVEAFATQEKQFDNLSIALFLGKNTISAVISEYYNSNDMYDLYNESRGLVQNNDVYSCYRNVFSRYMRKNGVKDMGESTFKDAEHRYDYLESNIYCDLINGFSKLSLEGEKTSISTYSYGIVLTHYLLENYGAKQFEEIYINSEKLYDLEGLSNDEEVAKKLMDYLEDKYKDCVK